MKLKLLREPDDYTDYLFWRSEHHRLSLIVITISLVSVVTPYILKLIFG